MLIEQLKVLVGNTGMTIPDMLGNWLISFFLYAFLGIILAVIAIVFLMKKKWLVRKGLVWNIFTKLFYVALLIVLPLSTGIAGSLRHVQTSTHEALEQVLLPAITEQMPAFNDYLREQISKYGPDEVISVKDLLDPILQDLYYTPQSDSLLARMKAKLINKLVLQAGAEALTKGLQKRIITQVEIMGEVLSAQNFKGQPQNELVTLGVDAATKFTTDAARELDFTQVNASIPQVIVQSITKAINGYFNTLYIMIVLTLMALAMLIAAEVLYYRRHSRAREQLT